MRLRLSSSVFVCTLALFGSAAGASVADQSRQAVASWLSQQLHRRVDASQILAAPSGLILQGCSVTRARAASTGAASLSLRCPAPLLPQLVLLNLPLDATANALPTSRESASASPATHKPPPLVRSGAALQADWRTANTHAQLPVVALDSGAAGAEIRVRIANTSRILRARILGAHTVAITASGA
jgi:hypothetical protein